MGATEETMTPKDLKELEGLDPEWKVGIIMMQIATEKMTAARERYELEREIQYANYLLAQAIHRQHSFELQVTGDDDTLDIALPSRRAITQMNKETTECHPITTMTDPSPYP
jgi:hypothetical protein